MFNLIRYGICHPKFLGGYIVEKTYKIVLVLVVMFMLLLGTIFGLNIRNTYLTDEEAAMINTMLVQETNVNYKNGTMEYLNEANINLGGISVIFDHDGEGISRNELNGINVVFTDEKVSVRAGVKEVSSKSYSDFDNYSFNLSKTQTIKDRLQFTSFLEEAFTLSYPLIYTKASLLQGIEVIFSAMMLALLIFLLTGRLNPQVKGKMRIRLLLTCFISYLFIYWFYFIFNQNMFLYLMTFTVPYLYFVIALGNILRISKVVK